MFQQVIAGIDNFMYSNLLVVPLVAAGVYFTVRTRFVQLRLFAESIRVVGEPPRRKNAISSFEALMVSTGSRVGTANIVAVSSALCLGGYGAVFWMWVTALLGAATAFIESTLAQIYKVRARDGSSYGGPSYYIERALKKRWLGVAFAVALILTYAGGFNMLASFNVIDTLRGYSFYSQESTPVVGGAVLAVLVAMCILGGGKRLAQVSSVVVPAMGVLYLLMSGTVLLLNYWRLPAVLGRIFADAFNFRAIFSGFASSCVMEGIKRGLYSNEAGVGSAPNAAAVADVSHPAKQGLAQMLAVFIDTMLICTATAMMCLSSGVEPAEALKGAPYVQVSMSAVFGQLGPYFITCAMILFAFTTLLGNLFYCESCLRYLVGRDPSPKFMTGFRLAACVVVFAGARLKFEEVWDIADVLMGVMVLLNLPVLLILGKTALAALNDYTRQRREGKEPVFRAQDIGLEGQTDFWR